MSRGRSVQAGSPGGDGKLVTAAALLTGQYDDRLIRLSPGGGEYEAVLVRAGEQSAPVGWVRLHHQRPELDHLTVNVVPGSTAVRVLH